MNSIKQLNSKRGYNNINYYIFLLGVFLCANIYENSENLIVYNFTNSFVISIFLIIKLAYLYIILLKFILVKIIYNFFKH